MTPFTAEGQPALAQRRRTLKLLAATAVMAAGGLAIFEDAPWLNESEAVEHLSRPLELKAGSAAVQRELIRAATLAANGHNAQPWRFVMRQGSIEIHVDRARRLPVVDPDDRELWISLGCALENMLVAAQASGFDSEVVYPGRDDVIRVLLTPDKARHHPLVDAIWRRQSTRCEYDGRPIKPEALERLRLVPPEPGIEMRFLLEPAELNAVADFVRQGDQHQYTDRAFVLELIKWLRFNKREALTSADGLYARCSGNPTVPRWLGQWFVAGTRPEQQAAADIRRLRSSSGVVLIASSADDRVAWVRTGQVYERLALTMTSLGLANALLNQPIEVPVLRGRLQQAVGLRTVLPQLLVRFGHAAVMPRSLRRPVEAVLNQA